MEAQADSVVARLMTIPGVDAIAGVAILAAVCDFHRFDDPDLLVAYIGLNPERCARPSGPIKFSSLTGTEKVHEWRTRVDDFIHGVNDPAQHRQDPRNGVRHLLSTSGSLE